MNNYFNKAKFWEKKKRLWKGCTEKTLRKLLWKGYTEKTFCKLLRKPKDWVATEDKNNVLYETDCSSPWN